MKHFIFFADNQKYYNNTEGDFLSRIWRCPQCSIINTSEKCVGCGYVIEQKDSSHGIHDKSFPIPDNSESLKQIVFESDTHVSNYDETVNSKELEMLSQYLRPKFQNITAFVLTGIMATFFLLVTVIFELLIGLLFTIFFGILCAFFIYLDVSPYKKWKAYITDCQYVSNIELLTDFCNGVSLSGDSIRLGEKYIITKGRSVPLKYTDITRVYGRIHRTNFVMDRYDIIAVDNKNKVNIICNLMEQENSKEIMAKVMFIIQTNNPDVKLGYK